VSSDFDSGAPTLLVNVYAEGTLTVQIPCESADAAALIVAEWESRPGIECEIEDLSVRHGGDDVLAPEPEDAIDELDDYRDPD
jgi:hypothetical protein